MSDSDAQSSGVTPDKHPINHRQYFLVAAAVGAVVIIALLFTLRGQHTTTPPAPSLTSPALVEPPISESESAITTPAPSEQQPEASEAASSEPEAVTAELPTSDTAPTIKPADVTPVDHGIIPADHSGPPWALNLISLSTPEHIPELIRQIKALGFNPEMVEVIIDGRHWFRVRIEGFATISAARQAGQTFVNDKTYPAPWIGGY